MKKLILTIVILSCGVLYAQQQRPQRTGSDLYQHIGVCEDNYIGLDKYAQQLEATNSVLQQQVAELQKQIADLTKKPAGTDPPKPSDAKPPATSGGK